MSDALDIQSLRKERDATKQKLDALDDAIAALRKVCSHTNREDAGHDSHYRYERCVACVLEFRN